MKSKEINTERIVSMCKKNTKLTDSEIQYILYRAKRLKNSKSYTDCDLFIDVFDSLENEAIVICHRPPLVGNSIYKEEPIGATAKRFDEPGVLRTLETGHPSTGLLARSQEGVYIKQTTHPITYKDNTIGVFIVEELLSNDNISKKADDTETTLTLSDTILKFIDDLVLVYDYQGILRFSNAAANKYYRKFGYLDSIQGMHFDNLTIAKKTFQDIQSILPSHPKEEINFNDMYFERSVHRIDADELIVVVLRDITNKKEKEAQLLSELVNVQEVHHRVKNNLQTVVSLLRLQKRRLKSMESKKALQESINRVMSISATHEILSQQKDDFVQLTKVLEVIFYNFRQVFGDNKDITFLTQVDEDITLDSNSAVTVAIILNELIQNSFEHAFVNDKTINPTVHVQIYNKKGTVFMIVKDNGSGYDIDQTRNNLGLQIIKSFTESKLNGILRIESDQDGTRSEVIFRKKVNGGV